MSDPASTLRGVTAALDQAGVAHMVVGSMASSFHGEPRSTMDIDVVVAFATRRLDAFLAALPSERWYVDAEAARDALRRTSMFNVIDLETGWKVDLIIRKEDAFSRAEFGRSEEAEILGVSTRVASAEDTVLAKLRWAAACGGSERQLRDARGVVLACGDAFDHAYVESWVSRLALEDLWGRVEGG